MPEEYNQNAMLDNEPIARKTLLLTYIIDTSYSMDGDKIGIVNNVMEEVIPELLDVGGADAEIKIAVLTFGTDAIWMYDKPISVEDFQWNRIGVDGCTNFDEALKQLNTKLSRKEFMAEAHLSFAPIMFLLSDGAPTSAYKASLTALKNNKWFKYGIKVALAIGSDADKNMLADFTGTMETVLVANNGEALAKMIKFVSLTSSEIGSRSSSSNVEGVGGKKLVPRTPEQANEDKQKEFIDAISAGKDPSDIQMEDGW